jgi:hypothetical protein
MGELIGADGNMHVIHRPGIGSGGCQANPAAAELTRGERAITRALARIPDAVFDTIVKSDNPPAPHLLAYANIAGAGLSAIPKFRAKQKRSATRYRSAGRERALRAGKLQKLHETYGPHKLLDFVIDRQPARNLDWREVRAWAEKHLHFAKALLLLSEGHDDQRRVGDCVDEAAADRALELTKLSGEHCEATKPKRAKRSAVPTSQREAAE